MIEVTENIIQISQDNEQINVSVVEQPIEIVANNVVYRESPTDKTPYWGFIEGDLPDQTDLVLEFEKKANAIHEHETSDVTGLDAKLTSHDTHVANSVVHVTQIKKDYWDSKAAGDHNHSTVYEPKNSNIQTHINTSSIHVAAGDRTFWDGKAAAIHYHSYNDLLDKPNLYLKANQTALDATNANVTALQNVSHSHPNSAALATVTNTGDGTKFHANDGTYKTVGFPQGTVSGSALLWNGTAWIENTNIKSNADSDGNTVEITSSYPTLKPRLTIHGSSAGSEFAFTVASSSLFRVFQVGTTKVFDAEITNCYITATLFKISLPTSAANKWLKCLDADGTAVWADLPTGSGASWGSISGTLSDQADLATALSEKALQSDLTTTNGNISSLSTAVSNISTDLDTAEADILALQTDKADKTEIPTVPTALSGFTNDLTAYYLKTETYTQTEINSYLSAKMKAHSIASGTQTSLTLDLATNNIFNIELSANASFSLTNPETTRDYYFYVKNTSASAITITLPNTADLFKNATETITAAKTKAFALQWNGTKRIWMVAEEIG